MTLVEQQISNLINPTNKYLLLIYNKSIFQDNILPLLLVFEDKL